MRVLKNYISEEVYRCIFYCVCCSQLVCKVIGLNIQVDHVHLTVEVMTMLLISKLWEYLKEK
ncbi:transposase [Vibrio parahaemolyticus]|uniref:transposase n=1 Tax=Vibrio parahaemolyticus TaxID=670 RepID=UPI001E59D71D|nr:transposase [Vibrio parahaemolyticus]